MLLVMIALATLVVCVIYKVVSDSARGRAHTRATQERHSGVASDGGAIYSGAFFGGDSGGHSSSCDAGGFSGGDCGGGGGGDGGGGGGGGH